MVKRIKTREVKLLFGLINNVSLNLLCILLILGISISKDNPAEKIDTVSLTKSNSLNVDPLSTAIPKGFFKAGHTVDLSASGNFYIPSQYSRPEKNERRLIFDFELVTLEVNHLNQLSLIVRRGYPASESVFTRETLAPGDHTYEIDLSDSRKLTMLVDGKSYISSFSFKPVFWASEDVDASESGSNFFVTSKYLSGEERNSSNVEITNKNERTKSISFALRWLSLWVIGISVFLLIVLMSVWINRKLWQVNNESS